MIDSRQELAGVERCRRRIAVKAARAIGERHRKSLDEVQSHRIQPGPRNHIPGEGLLSQRIDNRSGRGKVARLLGSCQRKIAQGGGSSTFLGALPRKEEKGLVLDYWAPNSYAVLISFE